MNILLMKKLKILNVYINKDGNEIKQIPLDVIIHNYYDNKNIISIQIIDNNDPLFFYCSKIDEIEYQKLKKEQSLFIEYKNFSDFIFKMLNNCLKDNYYCYIMIKKNEEAYFIIEEKTQFKKLNHLTLKLNSLNNLALKDHLNKILNEYKEKCDNLSKQNKELTQNFDKLKDEKKFLENNYEIFKKENEEKIVKLINEKEKEINRVNETSIKQKEIIQNYINQNNNLKEEMNQFKLNIEKLNNEKSKLIEENLNSKKSYKEIEEKYTEIYNELDEKTKNLFELKNINDELNQQITDFKIQNEELVKNKKDLEEEKEKNENIIKSLKLINIKFENKLKLCIKEINKANDIIEKFQNEIKHQKTKIKSMKAELNEKIKIINEKQIIIENLENDLKVKIQENIQLEEENISLNISDENYKIQIKEDENSHIISDNKYGNEESLKSKYDYQTEKEGNNCSQSNSDYNPSYFFTFYKNMQRNTSNNSNNKKKQYEKYIKIDNETLKKNEKDEEIKTSENSYINNDIYNNICSYQFREIKGNHINEFKKKRDYFSNFPFKLNKSDNLNNLIQKK